MEHRSTRHRTPRASSGVAGSSRSRRSVTAAASAARAAVDEGNARPLRQSNRRRVAIEDLVDLTNGDGSPSPPAPSKRRRGNASNSASSAQTLAPLNAQPNPPSLLAPGSAGSSLHGSFSGGATTPSGLPEQLEEINLANDDDDLGEDGKLLQKKQEDLINSQKTTQEKPKLADFKCVICLDDPTDLASTRCGHMFCDCCLRSALLAGQPANSRTGKCPVCRRTVKLNEIVPLEILVMKGKGKARAA